MNGRLLSLLLILVSTTSGAADCTRTSVGFTPLTDLGAGTYLGEESGLYPGGDNLRPASHDALLAQIGNATPLDRAGLPDPSNGRIVLLSIGMSNTTNEWQVFLPLAASYPYKNPQVQLVDGAQGGQDATVIADPAASYWTVVDQRLQNAGVTPQQVQAVWLKQAVAGANLAFPADAVDLQEKLRAIVQIVTSRYPNVRSVYLSSRIYAGYASTALNPEPFAYQSGFAVKWLIRDQLAGDPSVNADPMLGPVLAPWLSWGPYLWADGLMPRADGLVWQCADFNSDGTHPSASGRSVVASRLLDFFTTDPSTAWFLDCPRLIPPVTSNLTLTKLPSGDTELSFQSFDVTFAPTVYDLATGSIAELRADRDRRRARCLATSLADSPVGFVDPAPGDVTWYEVRARNQCSRGPWGNDLDGPGFICP